MGGPLSRMLADLLIENKIEAKIKENREWKKFFNWVRLIDDTFMNWTDSESRLHEFFAYLNSRYLPIKWTMEKEMDDKFHVFDIQLIRSGNSIDPTVYRNHLHLTDTYTIPQLKLGMRKQRLFTP